MLNGKEVDFTPPLIGVGTSKGGKRTSSPAANGMSFDATEEAIVDGPEGTEKLRGKRHWQLSSDGNELTIELDLDGPQGPMKSKRIFTRK